MHRLLNSMDSRDEPVRTGAYSLWAFAGVGAIFGGMALLMAATVWMLDALV